MLLRDRTRIVASFERPVAQGFTVTAEGQPLVTDYSSGVFGVKPAGATATDKFQGFSIASQINIAALPFMESVIAVAGAVSLSRANVIVGTVRAVGSGTGALTVVAAPTVPGPGEVSVNYLNGTVTFNAAQLTETVSVSYRFEPTFAETLTVQGMEQPGGPAAYVLNSVGSIESGDVYTTEFNTLIDWNTAAASGWSLAVKNALVTAYANDGAAVGDFAVVIPRAKILLVPAGGNGEIGYGSNSILGINF